MERLLTETITFPWGMAERKRKRRRYLWIGGPGVRWWTFFTILLMCRATVSGQATTVSTPDPTSTGGNTTVTLTGQTTLNNSTTITTTGATTTANDTTAPTTTSGDTATVDNVTPLPTNSTDASDTVPTMPLVEPTMTLITLDNSVMNTATSFFMESMPVRTSYSLFPSSIDFEGSGMSMSEANPDTMYITTTIASTLASPEMTPTLSFSLEPTASTQSVSQYPTFTLSPSPSYARDSISTVMPSFNLMSSTIIIPTPSYTMDSVPMPTLVQNLFPSTMGAG
ncbi:flocculation protein FLO11-like, partial [Branchiostoma floridae]|uniref:Flocculation protein FLO11-like n=1 Tax=Branchiostoma floridae TaxID=7739 RepID=A0A9J7L0H2_BRAFL